MSNPLRYTCLFGGGAIRGLAYVGTIRALEELGIEYDIIGGSSVGAIIASLIACGYKSYEIENFFIKVNFDLFKDIHLGFGHGFALSKGIIFHDWLNDILSSKFKEIKGRNITFKDLEKKLVIITTDITNFKSKEFSTYNTPDFEIADAIKISSSMPGLMAPYKYNDVLLADGDLQKASPMWRLSKNLNNSESRILEFRLEGDCSSTNDKNPISFINTIYSCVTDVATDFVSELYGKNDRYDYISINTGDIFFADFNLNREERRKLINIGYSQTIDYFKNILPQKKKDLISIYSKLNLCIKEIKKCIKSNKVEDAQWWLGQTYILLCENKEKTDSIIYDRIEEMKILLLNNITTILFFKNIFKNSEQLISKVNDIIFTIEERITESKLFLQLMSA